MNIVIFGAGGRAGRRAVAEARRRGHRVTAVVRDPAAHGDLGEAHVVAGDVTDAASVARAAAGQDAGSAPPWTCPGHRATSSRRRPAPWPPAWPRRAYVAWWWWASRRSCPEPPASP
ncbi:NAD(P)H-binding protein [Micromonospora sp. NPDC049662]|uniref:NAD(P)H-binding protein n=1 Tax=Micromonospora sp. NPDC049662 TaxID=3155397 RepID=UPI00341E1B51